MRKLPKFKTVTDFPHKVKFIENTWITLKDGTRLAARLWLPENADAQPVPAILEYLPYRKNDGTAIRDRVIHEYFAGHGYACLRVDMRGSGDSDGILLGEYLPQEQDDALEVIAWIASQPWCSGAVGMMGISWGGFNSLQVAARRPPALKAIVTVCSTVDRYTDDCHYMGGCLLGSDMPNWASIMFSYNALPPDPQVFGADWRKTWLERLDKNFPWLEEWTEHQLRDEFWKQGSVNEDYGAITCPVYAVGGWIDSYTNAVPSLLQHLKVPRKGLIGPWAHSYPHTALPQPSIGFLQECLRWWDEWLKGESTGIMAEPMLTVWMPDAVPPQPLERLWTGRWVAEPDWQPVHSQLKTYYLFGEHLVEKAGATEVITFSGSQLNGADAGMWCPYGNAFGMPVDQRGDDGLSLCFTTPPAQQDSEILGYPHLELDVSVDQPDALLALRLCDVTPGGASRLVTWALLNLTHRDGHEKVAPCVPGQVIHLSVDLNACAHRLAKGHQWRLSISPTYWPHAWPSPKEVQVSLHTGVGCRLSLPERPLRDEAPLPEFSAAEGAPLMEFEVIRPSSASRTFQMDQVSGTLQMTDIIDDGCNRILLNDITNDSVITNIYSITEGKPLSAKAECRRTVSLSRGDWQTRVETYTLMTSDAEYFHLTNVLDAFERDVRIFTHGWTKKIPRRGV